MSAHAARRGLLADPRTLAVLAFVASEAFFFGSLLAMYAVHRAGGLPIAREHLSLPPTLLFSLLLFASSGTIALASRGRMLLWLGVSMLLGTGFLLGQAYEYASLVAEGITPAASAWASSFFTLTGLHGAHVLGGLGLMAALALTEMWRRGSVRPVALESVAIYWHFVDAVWVAILIVVYAGTFL